VLPPPGKKGVKPVQSPGPFLSGMEPRYQSVSREDIVGEPLTKEEVSELVKGSLKSKRQLNMGGFPLLLWIQLCRRIKMWIVGTCWLAAGRDGLTHNMLENIHSHWKRKRVCKIKCKGVCMAWADPAVGRGGGSSPPYPYRISANYYRARMNF